MSAPFLDFHTHAKGCERYRDHQDVIVVQSLHADEAPHPRADFVTRGIHPMLEGAADFLERYHTSPDRVLNEWCQALNDSPTPVIGIGECGWDNRSPLTLDQQNELMDFHIAASEHLQLPLIFHIVGGWHHLLAKRKDKQSTNIPWIVHGFRGNPTLADQLTSAGIHLSLHPYCATPDHTPYLLESDETSIDIKTHYTERSITTEIDKKEIINLFLSIFPIVYQYKSVDL